MAQTLSFPLEFGTEFDVQAFDDSIRLHGVRYIHYRTTRCPVGMVDKYDDRHPDQDHAGCSRGFIHTKAGTITGLFTSSGSKSDQQDIGLLDGSTTVVTFPRTYDNSTEEMQVVVFDRFYVEDTILVPTWQLLESHITGRERLDFPAEKVMDIIDAKGKRYGAEDYSLADGQIVWNPGRGPAFNADLNKGTVMSIRYLYRPFWIASRIMHQVRLASVGEGEGKQTVRMPQQILLQREYISLNEEKDNQAPNPNSNRQVRGPKEGSFGPR
jgi:hypothetical protein